MDVYQLITWPLSALMHNGKKAAKDNTPCAGVPGSWICRHSSMDGGTEASEMPQMVTFLFYFSLKTAFTSSIYAYPTQMSHEKATKHKTKDWRKERRVKKVEPVLMCTSQYGTVSNACLPCSSQYEMSFFIFKNTAKILILWRKWTQLKIA